MGISVAETDREAAKSVSDREDFELTPKLSSRKTGKRGIKRSIRPTESSFEMILRTAAVWLWLIDLNSAKNEFCETLAFS